MFATDLFVLRVEVGKTLDELVAMWFRYCCAAVVFAFYMLFLLPCDFSLICPISVLLPLLYMERYGWDDLRFWPKGEAFYLDAGLVPSESRFDLCW